MTSNNKDTLSIFLEKHDETPPQKPRNEFIRISEKIEQSSWHFPVWIPSMATAALGFLLIFSFMTANISDNSEDISLAMFLEDTYGYFSDNGDDAETSYLSLID